MKLLYTVLYALQFCFVNSLPPSKLPNGSFRTYKPNLINPRNDLRLINTAETRIISKNWIENIAIYLSNKKLLNKDNCMSYDDLHIVSSLRRLDLCIERTIRQCYHTWSDLQNKEGDTLYFSWMPECEQGFKDVLFLISVEIKNNDSNSSNPTIYVTNVIQSPFWEEKQIQSIYLKNSLVDQIKNVSPNIDLNFDKLYEESIRFYLAWNVWYL